MTKRYSRQQKISWWNQHRLSHINAAIIGIGGIGTWTALQLSFLGIHKLVLIDMDNVENSNLNRQFFYEEDIGKPKTEALQKKLQSINKKMRIETKTLPFHLVHPEDLKNVDVVFDCLDNIETREQVQTWCLANNKVFIHSACSDIIGETQLVIPKKTKVMMYPESMKDTEQARVSCKDFDAAICTTNMIVASLQVDKFLDWFIRKDAAKPTTCYIRGKGLMYGESL